MAGNLHTTYSNKVSLMSMKISLKFVPEGPISNKPALVQIMARCRKGDKPLSDPMIYWRIDASLGLGELNFIDLYTNSKTMLNNVITWKQRRNVVIMSFLLRHVSAGKIVGWQISLPLAYNYLNLRHSTFSVNNAIHGRADSGFAPSQWETALLCNDVFHWLGASLELSLHRNPLSFGGKWFKST